MLERYQYLPPLIDPVAFSIGSFSVRWYSIMYLAAFASASLLLKYRIRKKEALKSGGPDAGQKLTADWLLYAISGLIVGARLGHVLFYNTSYYLQNPAAVVWPFSPEGSYTGLFGMSYFGGLLGVLCASWIFTKQKKISFLSWADFVIPAVPAGYFFGRIGNFLNGELYGRITSFPWGMDFGDGLLRHPTQLYEALTEGLGLFLILWVMRNRSRFPGQLLALYVLGYGLIRFGIEFLRESRLDETAFGFLDLSQLFSLMMVSSAAVLYHSAWKGYNRERINP